MTHHIAVGSYVRIRTAPPYPGIEKGDLGRVTRDREDGIFCVDMISLSTGAEYFVNLPLRRGALQLVSEKALRSRSFSTDPAHAQVVRSYKSFSGKEYRS